jgi:hypothetical protein
VSAHGHLPRRLAVDEQAVWQLGGGRLGALPCDLADRREGQSLPGSKQLVEAGLLLGGEPCRGFGDADRDLAEVERGSERRDEVAQPQSPTNGLDWHAGLRRDLLDRAGLLIALGEDCLDCLEFACGRGATRRVQRERLSWRWCFYVNLVIAVPTTIVALRLLANHSPPDRARIDIPGVLTWTMGLFALVFGFSNAETHGWGATATVVALLASPLLLTAFVLIERRVEHPLLPLHIVWNRARGGSYTAILATGAGVFAVFLFLTYFLQQNLAFSPLKTGLAFLPLSVVLIITSTTV